MKQMNLDLASEYLEMAATLTLIKSRMLVPSEESSDEDLFEDAQVGRTVLILEEFSARPQATLRHFQDFVGDVFVENTQRHARDDVVSP